MSVSALLGEGLVARQLRVAARDVVYVKGIFEASEGLGALFAERRGGGDLIVAAPTSRQRALDELLDDLVAELGAHVEPHPPTVPRAVGESGPLQ